MTSSLHRLVVVVAIAACHRSHDPESVVQLFAGTKAPALSGPVLGEVHCGDNLDKVDAALNKHATGTLEYSAIASGRTGTVLELVVFSRESGDPVADLTKLWGPPRMTLHTGRGQGTPAGSRFWYGDHVLVAVTPGGKLVHIACYVPLAEQLGAPVSSLFTFEHGKSLLGSTREEIAKSFKDQLRDDTLELPYDELGELTVNLGFDQGQVNRFHFSINMAQEMAPDRESLVLARFGKASLTEQERGGPFSRFGYNWSGRHVELLTSDEPERDWGIEVRAYSPTK
jgi:hypothetical protein